MEFWLARSSVVPHPRASQTTQPPLTGHRSPSRDMLRPTAALPQPPSTSTPKLGTPDRHLFPSGASGEIAALHPVNERKPYRVWALHDRKKPIRVGAPTQCRKPNPESRAQKLSPEAECGKPSPEAECGKLTVVISVGLVWIRGGCIALSIPVPGWEAPRVFARGGPGPVGSLG